MQIGSEQFRGKFVSRNKLPLPVDNKGRSTDFGQHLADAVPINGAPAISFPPYLASMRIYTL